MSPQPSQQALDIDAGRPERRWCRCGRPLTDPVSRLRGLGPECDPERRSATPQHDIDQDTIPGT